MSMLLVVAAGMAAGFMAVQDTESVLSGPRVAPTNVTSDASRFVEPTDPIGRMLTVIATNPRMLHASIQRFADGPEDVHLTDEQRAAIEGHMREFVRAQREFERDNRDELARIRRAAQASAGVRERQVSDPMMESETSPMLRESARQNVQRQVAQRQGVRRELPPNEAMQPESGPRPDPAALRARMQEINARGPQAADLERAIRAELTEAQRTYLDAELARIGDERMTELAMQRYREEAMAQFAEANERMAERMTRFSNGEIALDRLPERVRERLAAMSPEERERALERLRQRLMQQENQPIVRPNAPGVERLSPRQKAPPSMDDVAIPKPDSRDK